VSEPSFRLVWSWDGEHNDKGVVQPTTIHICNSDGWQSVPEASDVTDALCGEVLLRTDSGEVLEDLPEKARRCRVCQNLLDREMARLDGLRVLYAKLPARAKR